MGSFSIWHWLIILLVLVGFGYPIARIIRRTGRSPAWVLLCLVPFGFVIGLWMLAFVQWPIVARRPELASGSDAARV